MRKNKKKYNPVFANKLIIHSRCDSTNYTRQHTLAPPVDDHFNFVGLKVGELGVKKHL